MSEYKKQHYVPQFYLRHFSKDGVGLCRYSLANETSERRNIKNTCQSFNRHYLAPFITLNNKYNIQNMSNQPIRLSLFPRIGSLAGNEG